MQELQKGKLYQTQLFKKVPEKQKVKGITSFSAQVSGMVPDRLLEERSSICSCGQAGSSPHASGRPAPRELWEMSSNSSC